MMIPPHFRADAYDYEIPKELVAQRPSERREDSRLLVVPRTGSCEHRVFRELPNLLRSGDLLVANDARVLRARFYPKRRRGGAAQVLLLHPAAETGCWEAMTRPGRRVRPGDRLTLDREVGIEVVARAPDGNRIVRFYGIEADEAMEKYGIVPLPPYVRQPPPDADERYQTVYARCEGSVAAPTAGLHFSNDLLDELRQKGIGWATITLHVGAGTFRPVRTDDIRQHHMHSEDYEVPTETAVAISRVRAAGGCVVAIGSTTLRALEDSARRSPEGAVDPGRRQTDLFIHPPFDFTAVDALITNFHLPRTTLLMLVCAFGGTERVLHAYREAVEQRYRFYSFGDAMLLTRD